ncbi:hypothetical protein Thi970DRAFT_05008 [Thiorhodovibrio frisius]|uniref:Uncharacterized protein n=1 Tax=Thiorhodovibrio frisius TaxID=631362 RepID=H8Z8S7_9GAMM|nr:hypothetical protein Thi970DRAFT_05008 [Thiorhodovibrio frisius]WPL22371.1 hypothetical protein Thiofri_02533 [Thiorhodovibrio frisius]
MFRRIARVLPLKIKRFLLPLQAANFADQSELFLQTKNEVTHGFAVFVGSAVQ